MAQSRLLMRKIRDVLRLSACPSVRLQRASASARPVAGQVHCDVVRARGQFRWFSPSFAVLKDGTAIRFIDRRKCPAEQPSPRR